MIVIFRKMPTAGEGPERGEREKEREKERKKRKKKENNKVRSSQEVLTMLSGQHEVAVSWVRLEISYQLPLPHHPPLFYAYF